MNSDDGGSESEPPLSGDERGELTRLRAEVAALRARRGHRGSGAAATLAILGCLLAPVALTAVWVHAELTDPTGSPPRAAVDGVVGHAKDPQARAPACLIRPG